MIGIGLITGGFISAFTRIGLIEGLLSCVLIIPCLIDGLLQASTDYVSSNPKRIVFGFLAGVGMFISVFTVCNVFLKLK